MISRLLTGLSLAALVAVAGCPPMGPPAPMGVSHVDKIMLMSSPAPINWDSRPGPDGLQARVILFQIDQDLPVLLAAGTLEFLLFSDRVSDEDILTGKPVLKWAFPADRLAEHRTHGRIGWEYKFRLPWAGKPPKCLTATLIARYASPDGEPIYSKPIVIGMKPG